MPIRSLLLAAACLAVIASWTTDAPVAEAAPTSVLEQDLGKVAQGEIVTRTFVIHNPRDVPLRIARVDGDVPRLSARFKPEIPARGTGNVQVTWDTRGVEGDFEAHAVTRFVDGREPVTLSLTAHVAPLLEVLPARASYFSVYRGESARRELRIRNRDGVPTQVLALHPEGTHFTATLRPSPRRDEAIIELAVLSGTPPGRYQEALVVETSHADVPLLRLPVNVLVKDEVYANPDVVDLGNINLRQVQGTPSLEALLTRTLVVRKRQGTFRIVGIESTLPFVHAQAASESAAGAFRVDVNVLARRLRPGPIDGVIRIHTDDRRLPELLLPVVGMVQ